MLPRGKSGSGSSQQQGAGDAPGTQQCWGERGMAWSPKLTSLLVLTLSSHCLLLKGAGAARVLGPGLYGALPRAPGGGGSQIPHCTLTGNSNLTCDGFSGQQGFQPYGECAVDRPAYDLVLENNTAASSLSVVGCAYSIGQVALTGADKQVHLSANFSFVFAKGGPDLGSSGLAFVVGPTMTGCGEDSVGYGSGYPASGLEDSVAVVVKRIPANCVGLVYNGTSVGDYCEAAEAAVQLPNQTIPTNISMYAWVTYNGQQEQLAVYLSTSATRPSQPVMLTSATMDWPLAAVGFTGGTWTSCDAAGTVCSNTDPQTILDLAIQGGVPPPAASAPASGVASPRCTFATPSTLDCPGFSGPSGSGFTPLGLGSILYPLFQLELQAEPKSYNAESALGCAYSTGAVALEGPDGRNYFSANFSFVFERRMDYGSSGFALVIGPGISDCGDAWTNGFGADSPLGGLEDSLAVVFQRYPANCVALVYNGTKVGDNCQLVESSVQLPNQTIATNVTMYGWVSFNGNQGQLSAYLSSSPTKPQQPVFVTSASLPWAAAVVGFAGGTPTKCSADGTNCFNSDPQQILNLVAQGGVADDQNPGPQLGVPTPMCSSPNASHLSCSGFMGPSAVGFKPYGQGIIPYPAYPLLLQSTPSPYPGYLTIGCAYSGGPVSLLGEQRRVTFSAAFSFRLAVPTLAQGIDATYSSGFALVIGPALSDCGEDSVGYSSSYLENSAAVVFKRFPTPCLALAYNGSATGGSCQEAAQGVTLNDPKVLPANTNMYAWVTYTSVARQLAIYLSPSPSMPSTPTTTFPASLPWTSVQVGFTGGSPAVCNADETVCENAETQTVTSFSFLGGTAVLSPQDPVGPIPPQGGGSPPGQQPTPSPPPEQGSTPSDSTPSGSAPPDSATGTGVPLGAIIGGAVAGVLLLALATLLLIFLLRRQRRAKEGGAPGKEQGGGAAGPEGEGQSWERDLQHQVCRRYDIKEVKELTKDFSKSEELGRGAFGVVYRGVSKDGSLCAVKCHLRLSAAADKSELSDFEKEVVAISGLRHKNLIRLMGFCIDEGNQIQIYEFAPQGSLEDRLKESSSGAPKKKFEPLDFEHRLVALIGTSEALQYLHSQGIVHRDIKPGNVLLDGKLQAKVADFGLAKDMEADTDSSSSAYISSFNRSVLTRVAGTPGYLDPEYAIGNKVTKASDIYSYGVLMLELITGRKTRVGSKEDVSIALKYWKPEQNPAAALLSELSFSSSSMQLGSSHSATEVAANGLALKDWVQILLDAEEYAALLDPALVASGGFSFLSDPECEVAEEEKRVIHGVLQLALSCLQFSMNRPLAANISVQLSKLLQQWHDRDNKA